MSPRHSVFDGFLSVLSYFCSREVEPVPICETGRHMLPFTHSLILPFADVLLRLFSKVTVHLREIGLPPERLLFKGVAMSARSSLNHKNGEISGRAYCYSGFNRGGNGLALLVRESDPLYFTIFRVVLTCLPEEGADVIVSSFREA